MTHARTRIAAVVVAIAFAATEWLLARTAGLDQHVALLLALAGAALICWMAAAIALIADRAKRPSATDMRDAITLLRAWRDDHDAYGAQIADLRRGTAILAAAPHLAIVERELRTAAAAVERWDEVAADVPRWQTAAAAWRALARPLDPSLPAAPGEPDEEALRIARARLPFTKNLSSADLKAALSYLVEAETLRAAQRHFAATQDLVLNGLRSTQDMRGSTERATVAP